MAYRILELSSISASDLTKVNRITKMDVYAMALIDGEKRSKKKTPVDKEGGRNPTWSSTFKFNVMEFGSDRATLQVVLRSRRKLGDRLIGEVNVPIRELLEGWYTTVGTWGDGDHGDMTMRPPHTVSYQVRKQSGRAKGVVNLSYRFSDLIGVSTTTTTTTTTSVPPTPNYSSPGQSEPSTSNYPQTPHVEAQSQFTTSSELIMNMHPVPVNISSAATYPPPGTVYLPLSSTTYPPQPATAGYIYPQAGYAAYPPPVTIYSQHNRTEIL